MKKDKFLVHSQHCECLADDNVPAITAHDVVSGRVKCEGEIKSRSFYGDHIHIPPLRSYIITCMMEETHNYNFNSIKGE